MECNFMSSENSGDAQDKNMDIQLNESNDEKSMNQMNDLLKALNDSKSTGAKPITNSNAATHKQMKRIYKPVPDRRMPWSILPLDITPAQKAQTLAVYIKFMARHRHSLALEATEYIPWPPPIKIIEEPAPKMSAHRITRSGRSIPVYTDINEDSSDSDFGVSKTKKRKVSFSDPNFFDGGGIYLNKVMSLKRKTDQSESERSARGSKLRNDKLISEIL